MQNKKNKSEEEKKLSKEKFKKMFKKKDITCAFSEKEKEYKIKKYTYYLKRIILVLVALAILLMLINRTFLKENYKTDKIDIDIPLLSYFIKDDGNQIELKSIRKTSYLIDFFDEQLEKLKKEKCDNGLEFFYNSETNTAIYSISVEKKLLIKTIRINYAKGDNDCLCNTKKVGKEAEELCFNYKP